MSVKGWSRNDSEKKESPSLTIIIMCSSCLSSQGYNLTLLIVKGSLARAN